MYALLGSGRLARHLKFYLEHLGLPFTTWSRRTDFLHDGLATALKPASHVLLAVSDEAIGAMADHVNTVAPWRTLVHFSGALRVRGVTGAHPLMTFGEQLQEPHWYRTIPFVVEQDVDFKAILPGLPNPHHHIPTGRRELYHALCSLAGNSSFLLWQMINEQMQQLGLPRSVLAPFLHQVVDNAESASAGNFTGPVARGDWNVVRGHLTALQSQPQLLDAYYTYLSLARAQGVRLPEDIL